MTYPLCKCNKMQIMIGIDNTGSPYDKCVKCYMPNKERNNSRNAQSSTLCKKCKNHNIKSGFEYNNRLYKLCDNCYAELLSDFKHKYNLL